ncbi:acyl-CoA dehydrogenase [Rhodococcus rhodochrous]|nr:acyl-CoA dehydrogenase [Rhodococcus rhodochrous]
MDIDIAPNVADFREEVRTWFSEHLVGDFAAHRGVGSPTDDTAWDLRVEWERELSRGGWLGLTWPTHYGGRGLGLAEEIVFEYEYARAAAPARVSTQALDLLGPTLIACGTEEQRQRFLPKILSVEEMWGQGWSEPGAGSDLADVRTRATLDAENVWHVNGQKIWTTFGHHADWLYVLCRTDPDLSLRHRGLSLLLVDVAQDGVEIRPIENIVRSTEFSECFFNDALTPLDRTVGGINGGWPVVITTLGFERGSALMPIQLGMEREFEIMLDLARRGGAIDDPSIRRRLVDVHIGIKLMRATNLRVVADLLDEDASESGAATAAASVTTKLFASTHHQRMGELAMDILGAESLFEGTGGSGAAADMRKLFLSTRAETIYGGTAEIQRNIASERLLGLPR